MRGTISTASATRSAALRPERSEKRRRMGLGENFARLAAGCGAKVVIAARRKARLEALAEELGRLGAPQVAVLEMDVASEASVDAGFAAVDASGDMLDVVVNNAGVAIDGWALKLPTADFAGDGLFTARIDEPN